MLAHVIICFSCVHAHGILVQILETYLGSSRQGHSTHFWDRDPWRVDFVPLVIGWLSDRWSVEEPTHLM